MMMAIFPLLLLGFVLYLVLRDVRWGLVLLVLTLPLNNRLMFDLYLSPQLLPVRMVLITLFVASFLLGLRGLKGYGLRRGMNSLRGILQNDPFLLLLLILFVVRILSLYRPINLASSATFLAFYTSMVFLYGFMKFVGVKYKNEFLLKVYEFHAWVAFVASIYSLIQLFFFEKWARVLPGVWPSMDEPTRFGSTFWDINHFAPYVGSVIPFFLLKSICEKNLRRRILYILGFILTNLAMGMTLSRSGWLGYAFSLLILGLILLWRKMGKVFLWYFLTMLTMVSLVIVGVIYFNLPIVKRLDSLTTRVYNESVDAHQILNKGHFEIFSKYPVLGGGFGNFNDRFRETSHARAYFAIDPVSNVRLPSHSVWFEVMSETGLVGLVVFMTLIGLTLKNLFQATSSRDQNLQLVATALLASLCGLLFSGLFYHYNLEYFWVIIFLSVFVGRLHQAEKTVDITNYLISFFLVGLGAAIVLPALGKLALLDWDESIYAQVAQNIVRFRDPITLRWHLEKKEIK